MTADLSTGNGDVPRPVKPKRPFLLTLICLFGMTFFGVISLMVLVSIFYTGTFRDLINLYITGEPVSGLSVFIILLLMFVLNGSAFAGIVQMWRMQKKGYYIFGIPVLVIALYQLFQREIPVLSTVVLITLLVLFGIFYRKMN